MKLSKSREESVISVTRRSCKHGKCSVIGIFMLKLSSGKVLIITHWRVYEDKCSKFWGHTNLSYLLCMANINGLSLAPPRPVPGISLQSSIGRRFTTPRSGLLIECKNLTNLCPIWRRHFKTMKAASMGLGGCFQARILNLGSEQLYLTSRLMMKKKGYFYP